MYYLDLFSGIGGFALGAYWAGWRFNGHFFSETNEYCGRLYKRRFSNAISLGDIRNIIPRDLPIGHWFVTGGFPCQDISIAGRGEGIEGERSGLWFEMWRIIRDLQPRWVIAENVGAITFRGLSTVINSLAEIGYDAEWQDIRASDMGAPHRRERIWIVAYPTSMHGTSIGGMQQKRVLSKDVSNSECVGCTKGGNIRRKDNKQSGKAHGESHNISQKGCESNGAKTRGTIKGNWLPEPNVGLLVDGLPLGLERFEGRLSSNAYKRVDQLKALGNSIVPQIAELLFRRIKCLEEQMQ